MRAGPCGGWRDEVHPRACGEHCTRSERQGGQVGSSPRMRGTLLTAVSAYDLNRFIPAHAGNTAPSSYRPAGTSVHPRACGEHRPGWKVGSFITGSSPRMRGTHDVEFVTRHRHRFIPAHAGNTQANPASMAILAVHPRACGEHWTEEDDGEKVAGSSPRMRGTHFLQATEKTNLFQVAENYQ